MKYWNWVVVGLVFLGFSAESFARGWKPYRRPQWNRTLSANAHSQYRVSARKKARPHVHRKSKTHSFKYGLKKKGRAGKLRRETYLNQPPVRSDETPRLDG